MHGNELGCQIKFILDRKTVVISFGKPQYIFYSSENILILVGLNFKRQCARGK